MFGLRYWAAAVLVVALVGFVPLDAASAAPEQVGTSPDAASITVTKLVGPDGESLRGTPRVNARGQVLLAMSSDVGGIQAPVVWEDGHLTAVTPADAPAGRNVQALDFSDEGHIVGRYNDSGGGWVPFLWHEGEWAQLPTIGDFPGEAHRVNDHGQVLIRQAGERTWDEVLVWQDGEITTPPPEVGLSPGQSTDITNGGQVLALQPSTEHVIWQVGGGVTRTGTLWSDYQNYAINDNGQVVQRSTVCNPLGLSCWGYRAYLWENGRAVNLGTLGGSRTEVLISGTTGNRQLLSGQGYVVGRSQTPSGGWHAFLWQDGEMIDMGTLGGTSSEAYAINNHGQVVGRSQTPSGGWHAFLWQDGEMIDIGVLAGEGTSYALDINDRGQITGVVSGAGERSDRVLWTAPPCEEDDCPPDDGGGSDDPPSGDDCSLLERILGRCDTGGGSA